MVKQLYRVLYNFVAESPGELSISSGDMVLVDEGVQPDADGWVSATMAADASQSGFVPFEFIELASVPQASAVKASPSPHKWRDEDVGYAESKHIFPETPGARQGGGGGGFLLDATPSLDQHLAKPSSWSSPPSPVGSSISATLNARPPPEAIRALVPVAQVKHSAATEALLNRLAGKSDASVSASIVAQQQLVSEDDIEALFNNHEQLYTKVTKMRQESFEALNAQIAAIAESLTPTESRNATIVQQIGELDALIDEDRLKWISRLEKDRRLLEREKAMLAGLTS